MPLQARLVDTHLVRRLPSSRPPSRRPQREESALAEHLPELLTELAQAERDEEWALLVVLGWLLLLAFIVVVLLFSPVPWGAWIGLVVWALGVRSVFRDLYAAAARTRELRRRVEEEPEDGDA